MEAFISNQHSFVLFLLFIEFAGEKTHCFNGGMIARRRTVRM